MVSVIIVNYNTLELTVKCIESIKHYTKGINYEIIVVDNGSTESNTASLAQLFPDIKLILNKTNLGFAKGNNLGLELAQGEFILLLNSDAFLKNDAISNSVQFLKENTNVGAVTCSLFYPDGRMQHNCQRFPSVRLQLFELLRLQKLLPTKFGGQTLMGPFFSYDFIAFPDWVWGTYFMFSKNILEKLPGKKLPDSFFMYGEDMQWCWEIRSKGYKIAFLPEGRVEHMMGASNGNKDMAIQSNFKIFLSMYYPSWKITLLRFLSLFLKK